MRAKQPLKISKISAVRKASYHFRLAPNVSYEEAPLQYGRVWIACVNILSNEAVYYEVSRGVLAYIW